MTKKEAKIEALRIASAMLIYPPDFEEDDRYSSKEEAKVIAELKTLSDTMYKRAVKLGGEFNQYNSFQD